MMLALLDWLIIALILLSVWAGITQGAIKEFIGLTSWLIAAFVALCLHPYVTHFLIDLGYHQHYLPIVTLLTLFVLTVIFNRLLGKLMISFLDMVNLVWLDHALGAMFGLLRGMMIMLLAAYAIRGLHIQSFYVQDSHLIPIFNDWGQQIALYLDQQRYWQDRSSYQEDIGHWTTERLPSYED